tara:strand:- start:576 stop:875 length:300 start_codon:yes stop_codon:yes gene_type:complete
MVQLTFDYKAYRKESKTSKAAWESKNNKQTLAERVYDLLGNGKLANFEIARELEQPLSSICARINELKKDNLVEDSGTTTKSEYGKNCVRWQRKKNVNI